MQKHVYNSIKKFLYISVVYETYSKGIFYIDTFVISLKAFRKKSATNLLSANLEGNKNWNFYWCINFIEILKKCYTVYNFKE